MYGYDIEDDGFYDFLTGISESLSETSLVDDMARISADILERNGTSIRIIGSDENIARAESKISELVSRLPAGDNPEIYSYPEFPKRIAFITDAPTSSIGAAFPLDGFEGRYAPWLGAFSSHLLLPLRFSGNAYSVQATYVPTRNMAIFGVYVDRTPENSYKAIMEGCDRLRAIDVSNDDIQAYALSALAHLMRHGSELSDMAWEAEVFENIDKERLLGLFNDVKLADADDKDEAIDAIEQGLDDCSIVITGPENLVRPLSGYFDVTIDLR